MHPHCAGHTYKQFLIPQALIEIINKMKKNILYIEKVFMISNPSPLLTKGGIE
jgi:hypothetical protein